MCDVAKTNSAKYTWTDSKIINNHNFSQTAKGKEKQNVTFQEAM